MPQTKCSKKSPIQIQNPNGDKEKKFESNTPKITLKINVQQRIQDFSRGANLLFVKISM